MSIIIDTREDIPKINMILDKTPTIKNLFSFETLHLGDYLIEKPNGKSNIEEINHIRSLTLELIAKHPEKFDQAFMKTYMDVRYYKGVSIFKKLKRVKGMLQNIYKELVDLSYR